MLPIKPTPASFPKDSCQTKTASNALSTRTTGSPAWPAINGTLLLPCTCQYLGRPSRRSSAQRMVTATVPASLRVAITRPRGKSNLSRLPPSAISTMGKPHDSRRTYRSAGFQPMPHCTAVYGVRNRPQTASSASGLVSSPRWHSTRNAAALLIHSAQGKTAGSGLGGTGATCAGYTGRGRACTRRAGKELSVVRLGSISRAAQASA